VIERHNRARTFPVEVVGAIAELGLEDIHVGRESVLPNGGGLKAPLSCLSQARSLLGANSILDEYPVRRHAMHTLIVGEEITGFQAFL
jgi:hypothetical protein